MPTPVSEQNGGVGGAAKSVAEHASAIARLEVELAALELKKKVAVLGIGIGLVVGAAVFGLIGLGFVFLTIAAGLDTFLATWLALLLTTLLLFVIAGVLGLVGYGRIKKGTPPVPEQAIAEAKLTQEALQR
jgi:putative superfamily III holin-X